MEKLQNIDNFMSETGLYEQRMEGYKDGNYTLQVFVACNPSWFYVLIYNENDELIGVSTFITEGKQTALKIKYARNIKIVEKLTDKLIKIKEQEYENGICEDSRF